MEILNYYLQVNRYKEHILTVLIVKNNSHFHSMINTSCRLFQSAFFMPINAESVLQQIFSILEVHRVWDDGREVVRLTFLLFR